MNITILYGGTSSERQVSIWSKDAIQATLATTHQVTTLDTRDSDWQTTLQSASPDFVFIALHGGDGENGAIQAILESLNIPYNGSGPSASALALDKQKSKALFAQHHLPIPHTLDLNQPEFPSIIKPRFGGSSLGTTLLKTPADLPAALKIITDLSDEPLLEEYIAGPEFTCAILSISGTPKTLPVFAIKPPQNTTFFDFDSKYSGKSQESPADLPADIIQNIDRITTQAFEALGCRGYARADFILKNGQDPILLEVNTLPGLTETSLLPQMAQSAGISFDALLDIIIQNGLGYAK